MHVLVQVCHPPPPACGVWEGGQVSKVIQTFLSNQPPPPVPPPPGGRVYLGLGLIFAGYVPLAPQNPYLMIVYSVAIIIIDLILVSLAKRYFHNPVFLFMHLHYNKQLMNETEYLMKNYGHRGGCYPSRP